jgi:hypothetical protein
MVIDQRIPSERIWQLTAISITLRSSAAWTMLHRFAATSSALKIERQKRQHE